MSLLLSCTVHYCICPPLNGLLKKSISQDMMINPQMVLKGVHNTLCMDGPERR